MQEDSGFELVGGTGIETGDLYRPALRHHAGLLPKDPVIVLLARQSPKHWRKTCTDQHPAILTRSSTCQMMVECAETGAAGPCACADA